MTISGAILRLILVTTTVLVVRDQLCIVHKKEATTTKNHFQNLSKNVKTDFSLQEWDQQMRDCCKTWFSNGAIPRQTDPMVSRGCRTYI